MLSHRSHWRPVVLLCLLCASLNAAAVNPAPPGARASTLEGTGNVTCRYRLDGLQTKFTQTNQTEAHYSSLRPGNYTFQVSCDSPKLGQTFSGADSFTVGAPWWQRWAAEIAGSGGVVLLVWGIVWNRYRERHEKERLEQAVTERSAELARANRELKEVSLRDPLTGMRNRRFFQSTIAADASQAMRAHRRSEVVSRNHRDLIFFLLDIDHFKAVNDEYGHDAGDRVLVQIAQRLNSVVREADFLIRWGGEEFLLVCRSAARSDSELIASRILKSINAAEFDLGNGRRLSRSCSVGWAAYPWLPADVSDLSVDEVLRLADRGLYLAKHQGRNQAVGLVPTTVSPVVPPPISLASGAPTAKGATGDALEKTEKYCSLEQLIEGKLIREVRTPGGMAAAATG